MLDMVSLFLYGKMRMTDALGVHLVSDGKSVAGAKIRADAMGRDGDGSAPVTVAVCTRARLHYVERCLAALAALVPGGPAWRLVIVDNDTTGASAARLQALIAPFADALYVACPEPGLSHARNAAIAVAAGGWMAFLDDDSVPSPTWLQGFGEALAAAPASTAVITGRIDPDYEAPLPPWWRHAWMGMLSVQPVAARGRIGIDPFPDPVWPIGANVAFAVAPLRAIGGFPPWIGRVGETLLSGEEAYVARRLEEQGFAIWYDDRMRAAHTIQAVRLSPAWLLRRMAGQGATEAWMDVTFAGRGAVLREALVHSAKVATHWPLGLVSASTARFIGRRCGLAFAWGYLRAAPAALMAPSRTRIAA